MTPILIYTGTDHDPEILRGGYLVRILYYNSAIYSLGGGGKGAFLCPTPSGPRHYMSLLIPHNVAILTQHIQMKAANITSNLLCGIIQQEIGCIDCIVTRNVSGY